MTNHLLTEGDPMSSTAEVIDRIVADNDPRNGTIGQRIIRMLEEPDRRPDADGLYRDDPKDGGGS